MHFQSKCFQLKIGTAVFQNISSKVKVLKSFKICNVCHIKTCQFLKEMAILSSIVIWGNQDNVKPVCFSIFFTKRFWAYKNHWNPKQTIFTLLEVFLRVKKRCLCCFLFACFCFYWLILVDLRFCTLKIFS